ncbi:hypothetical protein LCGC14_2170430, partial [marine sediment metagenome]
MAQFRAAFASLDEEYRKLEAMTRGQ